MKKSFKLCLIFIIILNLFICFACGKEEMVIQFEMKEQNVELVLGEVIDLDFTTNLNKEEIKKTFKEEQDIVNVSGTDSIKIEALKVGSAILHFSYLDKDLHDLTINVIENPLYLPVPTGKLILKGIEKEATVKVIITKEELLNQEITWTVETEGIVSYTVQGAIIKFSSLKRGSTKVTVTVGNYSNSFMVYVANIRGDIE